MDLNLCIDGVEKKLDVEKKDGVYRFNIDGNEYNVTAENLANGSFAFFVNNRSFVAHITKTRGGTYIAVDGRNFLIEGEGEDDDQRGGSTSAHADGKVESPMPGNIIAVHVKEGDIVEANQAVVVIESMKMQNEIVAPCNGQVIKVGCAVGEQVNFGDLLVEIAPQE